MQFQQIDRFDLLQADLIKNRKREDFIKKAFEQIPEVIAAVKNHERLPSEWWYLFASAPLDEDPCCVKAGSELRPMIRIDLPLRKDKDGCYVIRYRE